jgi:hypothetical protein
MTLHHDAVSSYPDLDGVEEVIECLGAEKGDIVVRGTGVCAGIVNVGPVVWWEENMAGSNKQDLSLLSPPSVR